MTDVQIPESDAVRPVALVVIGVAGLTIGIALTSWASSRRPPTSAAPSEQPRAATEEPPAEHVAEEVAEEVVEVAERGPEAAREAAGRDATGDLGTEATGPLRVVRGRVAYLRCDGVEGPGGCPRDEPLETAAWTRIETLATCAQAPARPGEADLRIELLGEGAADPRWRDTFPEDAIRLDRAAVEGCLLEPLREVRQSTGAARLIVSFRFSMR
ncbi:MAG: hypothetical protein IT378_13415 [Sandaracinaceae bacterium]|nr:hypothetical protein [Sandaracinaceae bacterium]